MEAIKEAFESAGIEFIFPSAESGPGVRLKIPARPKLLKADARATRFENSAKIIGRLFSLGR
jgi:hypothetical protein